MALTTVAGIPQEFFAELRAQMLIQPDDQFIYLENGPLHPDNDQGPEMATPGATTVTFDRETLPTGTMTETSRRLTDGTDVSSNSLAIAETQVTLTYREYGGPHDGSTVVPFGLTQMAQNRAIHNLPERIGGYLRRDRNKWLNMVWQASILATTNVVTVGNVAEGSITANQALVAATIRRLNRSMTEGKVPRYPNGKWRCALATKQMEELKADTSVRQDFQFVPSENPAFRGYVGSYEGFDFAQDTLMPTKGVGAGSAVTGYQGAAWGPYGLARSAAINPEPRADTQTDFGRRQRIIWYSIEAIGVLYSDLLWRIIST